MTRNELQEAYKKISQKRLDMMPQYLEIMKNIHPELLKSPKEIFMQECGISDPKLIEDIWELKQEDKDYRDPQWDIISSLFYEELYRDKDGLNESEKEFVKKFSKVLSLYGILNIEFGENQNKRDFNINRYIDSKIVYFENEDIVITDPCYVIPDEFWSKSGFGFDLSIFSIPDNRYATHDTIYGDWSCTVYSDDRILGRFCADAGLVSVMSLKDIEKINKSFEDWAEQHNWCVAVIEDFTGTVQIKTDIEDDGIYCYVEGKGSVNFTTRQTGF